MPEDLVTMRHPEVHLDPDIPSSVMPREVFEVVWKPKGWVEVTSPAAAPEPAAEAAPEPATKPAAARFAAPTTATGGEPA